MSNQEAPHAAFDAEEQAILAAIKDDDGEMQPADDPAPEPAPATTAAPATDPTAADTKPADAPAAEPPAQEQPHGDVRAALRASRRSEQRARQEAERLREENEALRKAAPTQATSTELTPDELEAMKLDFPIQHKLYLQQQELARQLAETRPAQPAKEPEFEPIQFTAEVQELVDQVPDLLAWQYDPASQDKLQRAIEYDDAMKKDPDWAGKPLTERFQEAVNRTKRAFGVTTPVPPANRTDPAARIAALQPNGPQGISDFGGGQPASAPTLDFSRMSDEDILARLPVLP